MVSKCFKVDAMFTWFMFIPAGRLLLRYEGCETAAHDFWLFYLNIRVHPVGWGQDNGLIYHPPSGIQTTVMKLQHKGDTDENNAV